MEVLTYIYNFKGVILMYEEVKGILKKYSQEKDFLITKVTACVLGTLILVDEYEDERYKKSAFTGNWRV